jgi:TfoX/Sxy family transcriptional regulator of competence genes
MAYNEILAKRIRAKLKPQRGIVEKAMFGGIGFLLRGNMACGVHGDDMIVRLGERDFEAALKVPGARVFDMTGRPMKGWVLVSAAGYKSDASLEAWIKKSLVMAKSLPAKEFP